MKAQDSAGRKVTIRLCTVNTPNEARRILKEIAVLRRLQEVPGNVFTTELIEVLLPSGEQLGESPRDFSHLFIVTEDCSVTLATLLNSVRTGTQITGQNTRVIAYNLLCALNFLRQNGLVHGKLSPATILVDDQSQIRIGAFELVH